MHLLQLQTCPDPARPKTWGQEHSSCARRLGDDLTSAAMVVALTSVLKVKVGFSPLPDRVIGCTILPRQPLSQVPGPGRLRQGHLDELGRRLDEVVRQDGRLQESGLVPVQRTRRVRRRLPQPTDRGGLAVPVERRDVGRGTRGWAHRERGRYSGCELRGPAQDARA